MSAQTEAGYNGLLRHWKQHLWQHRKRWGVLTALLAVIAVVWVVLGLTGKDEHEVFDGLPHHYTYLEAASPGKIQLHMMSLNPGDVVLRRAGLPLRQIAAYGINGGFFYGDDLLSIAIMNDQPVNGEPHGYGSGWFNAKYKRGTLVWDGAAGAFSVQVAASGDDLAVSDRGNYWAQGGISMNLQREELWAAAAAAEHLSYESERRLRSGLVYDQSGKLWLLVTKTLCTAAEFRTAVLETVPGEGREGIFLDGDGSSQMNADEAVLTGDSRPVVQMIAVAGGK